jgi:hypothetical protein
MHQHIEPEPKAKTQSGKTLYFFTILSHSANVPSLGIEAGMRKNLTIVRSPKAQESK